MSITTFVLTFFLSQAYALWRNIYTCGRKIQGRLNDVSLVLACSVERNKNGEYTDRGLLLLNDVAMSCRLCHAFSWAGFVKRYQILLSPRGLSRMLRCVVCVCVFCLLVSFCILNIIKWSEKDLHTHFWSFVVWIHLCSLKKSWCDE